MQKLPMECALDDTPETRLTVALFEQDTRDLLRYMKGLWKCCHRLIVAQQEVTVAVRSLTGHLRSYPSQRLLDSESGVSTIREFAQTMEEIGSWHHALSQQLSESMAAPVHRYIDKELQEVFTVGKLYNSTTEDMDQALSRYARASTRPKPELESERIDAAHEAYVSRKKFHQIALLYFNKMNLLQHSRKMALVDPLLGFMQAYRSFHGMGNGALNVSDTEEFLSSVSKSSQTVQEAMSRQMADSADLMDAIISRSEPQYPMEPPAGADVPSVISAPQSGTETAEVPPELTAGQDRPEPAGVPLAISGHLFFKSRYMGVMSQWERAFFFTEGCQLMITRRGELAGRLFLELDNSTITQPLNNEDRHAVFQISTNRRSVIMQALNERVRDEWLIGIGHLVRSGAAAAAGGSTGTAASSAAGQAYSAAGSILSGVSHFFVDKLHQRVSSTDQNRGAETPDSLSADTPIVFELPWTPEDDECGRKRCPSTADSCETPPVDSAAVEDSARPVFVGQRFEAQYLGSMEVQADRGHRLVSEVIRQVTAARQQHRLPPASTCTMQVGMHALQVLESDGRPRAVYPFPRVSFWASHLDIDRLMGLICVTPAGALFCHVFQTESVASQQLCSALTHATAAAYRRQRDDRILLDNIRLQPDMSPTAETSDGSVGKHTPESDA